MSLNVVDYTPKGGLVSTVVEYEQDWQERVTACCDRIFDELERLDPIDQLSAGQFVANAFRDQVARNARVRRAAVRRLQGEGWTQREMARESGLSQQRIAQLMAGDTPGNRSRRK